MDTKKSILCQSYSNVMTEIRVSNIRFGVWNEKHNIITINIGLLSLRDITLPGRDPFSLILHSYTVSTKY